MAEASRYNQGSLFRKAQDGPGSCFPPRPMHWLRSTANLPACIALCVAWCSAGAAPKVQAQKTIPPDAAAPLAAIEAASSMEVPEGFRTTLFADEPDVMQPIGFCIDDRNRLWVAEAYNYPHHGTEPGDRIVILEDTNGDGRHDERTVFFEGLNYVTGIEVGFGGAWVMSPPNMYFIPDRDGDDVPDKAPQVLLDGFGNHANAHNLANGFAWGPDGWLYATHGRTNWSLIGRPGEDASQRQRFDGGVWRYHPTAHVWEPFADGTTNPWGIDWNDYGDAFICNCVNPHLFQVIPGAHYEPWRGRKSSQYAFQRIDTIADHLHFVGLGNVRNGIGTSAEDSAGGGHAHCGTMVYLGGSFPDPYRNQLFTNNIHGKRINQDLLKFSGSGYTASHGSDLIKSRDPWFMGVTLAYGSAGEVYVSDWSDTGECHSTRNTRRHTGRIFRITFGGTSIPSVNLGDSTNAVLVSLQRHPNDWMVRHARRLLQERHHAGQDMTQVRKALVSLLNEPVGTPTRLRALWALHVTGGVAPQVLEQLSRDKSPFLQQWSIRLGCEDRQAASPFLPVLSQLAKRTSSPRVRLELACSLQRLDLADRWSIAETLAGYSEDASDQNLPFMLWYGIEPLVDDDLIRFANFAVTAKIPRVRENIARRIAVSRPNHQGVDALCTRLASSTDSRTRRDILQGLLKGFEGSRRLPMPKAWPVALDGLRSDSDPAVRQLAVRLALLFQDATALAQLKAIARDPDATTEARVNAISSLVNGNPQGLGPLLVLLLEDTEVRLAALQGLCTVDEPTSEDAILTRYRSFSPRERQAALNALAARPASAQTLVNGLEEGRIDSQDITAFTARQIETHGDPSLTERLSKHWGEIRATPRDQEKQISQHLKALTPDLLSKADLSQGAKLFDQHCATCHRFFGKGGKVGPDITGIQRTNLRYLLENIVSPNSSVAKDYQMRIVRTTDGRVITGLLESQSSRGVVIVNTNGRHSVPSDELEQMRSSEVSVMPTGLLDNFTERQVRDLIGFIQKESPTP